MLDKSTNNRIMNPVMLIQYIRHRNGQLRGALVGTTQAHRFTQNHIIIGWSLCKQGDMFNKDTAIKIATSRATYEYYTRDHKQIPPSINEDIIRFSKRCQRYFKRAKMLPELEHFLQLIENQPDFYRVKNCCLKTYNLDTSGT